MESHKKLNDLLADKMLSEIADKELRLNVSIVIDNYKLIISNLLSKK